MCHAGVMPSSSTSSPRLSVDDWVSAAIEIATAEGIQGIKINRLCERLGVTKGSFYWHFADLDALLGAIAEAYGSGQDATRLRLTELQSIEPRQRLVEGLQAFVANDLGRLDNAMRSWAQTDERARVAVVAADQYKFGYLVEVFRELGFGPGDADLRAKTLYYTGVGFSVVGPLGRKGTERQIRDLVALFTD